jgi:hypothetical protein
MTTRSILRLVPLAAVVLSAACSRFVWHEDPFTPDLAPTSEVVASGADTTYVLRTPSYYLLSEQRAALWNREVLDDVAWRYRALFGQTPPMIAIRIDSVASADTATTFRGVPLARVTMHRRADVVQKGKKRNGDERREFQDSVRARILGGPVLAATTAQAWLAARADSNLLPSWIEIGALRILGSRGAPDRAAMELRANEKAIAPLASLFAVRGPRPNAADVARVAGAGQFEVGDNGDVYETAQRRTPPRREVMPGVSPVFMAQAVSVLAFIHDRDAGVVSRLADELPRGQSVESVLASSATLPHDVAGLDAAWKQWLKRSQKTR